MLEKRPVSIILTYKSTGSYNATTGVYTEGGATTVPLKANVSQKSGRYISKNGDVIVTTYLIILDRFSGDTGVPEGATITFNSKTYTIVKMFCYQRHVEITC